MCYVLLAALRCGVDLLYATRDATCGFRLAACGVLTNYLMLTTVYLPYFRTAPYPMRFSCQQAKKKLAEAKAAGYGSVAEHEQVLPSPLLSPVDSRSLLCVPP